MDNRFFCRAVVNLHLLANKISLQSVLIENTAL